MATIISQAPLYSTLPVAQDVILTVKNSSVVGTESRVKFIAKVYISDKAINISTDTPVGTFKTTPNNAGVGMFDFRPIIESFVSADNLGNLYSQYKTDANKSIPIHLIDKYSTNKKLIRFLAVEFGVEYLGATDCSGNQSNDVIREACGEEKNSITYTLFNGYLKHSDVLDIEYGRFGYSVNRFNLRTVALGGVGEFLTNAPSTQYANIDDYGTLSVFSKPSSFNINISTIYDTLYTYYDSSGVISSEAVLNSTSNGGYDVWNSDSKNQALHLGCFPANLKNWSSTFTAAIPTLSYYTILCRDNSEDAVSELITININCPTLKGYEPVRLTWLNQWGAWDYYTFNMKSTKSISTKGSTYQQIEGTWNDSTYQVNGYKGGKKSFRVNAVEKISMNTDFVSEAESEWFEELINSPEVYVIEGYKTQATDVVLNSYVSPVRLTTSSYTKKTVANDKLMQYTFEVEKSKTLRTQSV